MSSPLLVRGFPTECQGHIIMVRILDGSREVGALRTFRVESKFDLLKKFFNIDSGRKMQKIEKVLYKHTCATCSVNFALMVWLPILRPPF